MKLLDDFRENLQRLDLAVFDQSDDVVFVVDVNYRMTAYNTAYADFGKANGLLEIEDLFGLGCSVLEAISGPSKDFFHAMWTEALEDGEVKSKDYECSSPVEFRLYRQTAYPLPNKAGLIISNHCVVEYPMNQDPERTPVMLTLQHTNAFGMVIQCGNCRKVKNQASDSRWDWVPEAVSKALPDVSHSICPFCLEHYYPDE